MFGHDNKNTITGVGKIQSAKIIILSESEQNDLDYEIKLIPIWLVTQIMILN
jgi:hypothetical protein